VKVFPGKTMNLVVLLAEKNAKPPTISTISVVEVTKVLFQCTGRSEQGDVLWLQKKRKK
jgi:hypothetical protein